jgi:class III poly(R)-hydroxyalkanoic acid synthase PhaE subunit
MSDKKSAADWSKDWQALQRQYWTAWSDLTRNQAGAQPDASTPWHEGLEQWARMFGSAGKQSEATERLMASAKNYLALMQSMLAFAGGKDGGGLGASSWLDALKGGFNMPGLDTLQTGFSMPGIGAGLDASSLLNNPMAKALRDISGQGVKGFQELASGAAPMLAQMKQEGMSWLQMPAFGYLREHQEHYQKMAVAFAEFQEATKRYNALIMKSSQRSFEILENKIAERAEPGRQIDSMRALYDLWVDAAEEAYAEVALSDEFRKVYGDVVNSQMRVRSQLQQEVERIGVDLGMPTRTELNSVHKRLHDLRRELRNGRGSDAKSEDDGRDAEIAALRAEVDELRSLVNDKPESRRAKSGLAPEPAHEKTRPRRRAPQRAVRAPAPKPTRATRVPKAEPGPVTSFGDAIAAMRKQTTGQGKKPAKGAKIAVPVKAARTPDPSSRGKA